MRIAIIGAGSIGGYLAAKLLLSGQPVTVIVRGANLAAIRANGLKLRLPDGTEKTAIPDLATDDLAAAGPQDVVILGVKGQQLSALAPTLGPLLGPETAVVPAQNGIPWWYFQRHRGPFEGRRLESVDPGGAISAHIGSERVIGCVAYQAAELVEPGIVRFVEGNRFTLGEPDGEKTERVMALAQALTRAGLKVPVRRDIRTEIWVKLLGNMTFNPISALTRSTLGQIIGFEPTRNLVVATMAEAQEVASRGITINCVAPGFIATAMTDQLTEAQREKMTAAVPAGRLGSPEDVATAVLFLASEEATYVTGQTLHVNGGMAMI